MTVSPKQRQRDLVILQLLCALPTHAYDLERHLLGMGEWWSRKGGVHKHLKSLQADELVTSAWDFPSAGPARLVYTITEAGMVYLQRFGCRNDHASTRATMKGTRGHRRMTSVAGCSRRLCLSGFQ